jgi:hypothetical protein
LHRLRNALSKALTAIHSKCEVPIEQSDVCAAYTHLISSIRAGIEGLENEEPRSMDIQRLQLKAEAVRRQNRRVRTKLKTL